MTGPSSFVRETEPYTGHEILRARSRAGVEIRTAPMPGFAHTYAMFTARCGSLDETLPSGETLPAGTAHFLEHKMFQKGEVDLFDVYDRRGASANAFTTHTSTSYVFSATRLFDENLETLLSSLRTLETDAEGVIREREIIAQEIAMWDDDPSWCGYLAAMEALYRNHPVRTDIAGTRTTIDRIDVGVLEAVHRAYYSPRNLVLVVAGDVDPVSVLEQVDRAFPPGSGGRRRRRAPHSEPAAVCARERVLTRSVSRPHLWWGWKDTPPGPGRRLVRRQVLSALALDVLFGDGGRVQAPLYREGWIDDSFQASYEAEADVGHLLLQAEVDDVPTFRRRLTKAIRQAMQRAVGEDEVERARRRLIGGRLRIFNSPESVAQWLLAVALTGVPAATAATALREATARSVTRRLRDLLSRPQAVARVLPQ